MSVSETSVAVLAKLIEVSRLLGRWSDKLDRLLIDDSIEFRRRETAQLKEAHVRRKAKV